MWWLFVVHGLFEFYGGKDGVLGIAYVNVVELVVCVVRCVCV